MSRTSKVVKRTKGRNVSSLKMVKVSSDFPQSLLERADKAIEELHVSRSELVRAAVEDFLTRRERQRVEKEIEEYFRANADFEKQVMQEFQPVDTDSLAYVG
jgi:metal-responsive CopG/Arc/MetJ family transcriptional regulator